MRGTRQPGEKEVMRIHTLAEAYEMIFCKLADMTQEKTLRYRNVYHKRPTLKPAPEPRRQPPAGG
ncbi:MAG: hypothetical protein V8S99_07930 [Oscillospiraceae bacterium]